MNFPLFNHTRSLMYEFSFDTAEQWTPNGCFTLLLNFSDMLNMIQMYVNIQDTCHPKFEDVFSANRLVKLF